MNKMSRIALKKAARMLKYAMFFLDMAYQLNRGYLKNKKERKIKL